METIYMRIEDYRTAYDVLGSLMDCRRSGTEEHRVLGEARRIMQDQLVRTAGMEGLVKFKEVNENHKEIQEETSSD